jgi:hypothetical protein
MMRRQGQRPCCCTARRCLDRVMPVCEGHWFSRERHGSAGVFKCTSACLPQAATCRTAARMC